MNELIPAEILVPRSSSLSQVALSKTHLRALGVFGLSPVYLAWVSGAHFEVFGLGDGRGVVVNKHHHVRHFGKTLSYPLFFALLLYAICRYAHQSGGFASARPLRGPLHYPAARSCPSSPGTSTSASRSTASERPRPWITSPPCAARRPLPCLRRRSSCSKEMSAESLAAI